jgi:hypothetical protein
LGVANGAQGCGFIYQSHNFSPMNTAHGVGMMGQHQLIESNLAILDLFANH